MSSSDRVAHLIAAIAALGTLAGLGMGVPGAFRAVQPDREFGLSVIASLVLGLCCLVILVTAVRSFIAARKARKVFTDTDSTETSGE